MDDLIVDNITKRYGRGRAVLSNLNHRFKGGTATGLIGPNGSGKTTLLRLLSTTSFPTEGSIRYGDTVIHKTPYAYLQRVGIVHSETELPRFVNSVELLEYALRTRNAWNEESKNRISYLLDTLDLDERRQQLIGTYSSGMFKKTQIALALAAQPSILLMDEPFRGLDEKSLEAAVHLFEQQKQAGCILVLASHRKDILDRLCEGFLDMDDNDTTKKE